MQSLRVHRATTIAMWSTTRTAHARVFFYFGVPELARWNCSGDLLPDGVLSAEVPAPVTQAALAASKENKELAIQAAVTPLLIVPYAGGTSLLSVAAALLHRVSLAL